MKERIIEEASSEAKKIMLNKQRRRYNAEAKKLRSLPIGRF